MAGIFEQSDRTNTLIFIAFFFVIIIFRFSEFLSNAFILLLFGILAYAFFSKNRIKSIVLLGWFFFILLSYDFYPLTAGHRITFSEVITSLLPSFPFFAAFTISVFFATANYEDKRKQTFCYILSAVPFFSIIVIILSGIN
jgi:hypothetical protein